MGAPKSAASWKDTPAWAECQGLISGQVTQLSEESLLLATVSAVITSKGDLMSRLSFGNSLSLVGFPDFLNLTGMWECFHSEE